MESYFLNVKAIFTIYFFSRIKNNFQILSNAKNISPWTGEIKNNSYFWSGVKRTQMILGLLNWPYCFFYYPVIFVQRLHGGKGGLLILGRVSWHNYSRGRGHNALTLFGPYYIYRQSLEGLLPPSSQQATIRGQNGHEKSFEEGDTGWIKEDQPIWSWSQHGKLKLRLKLKLIWYLVGFPWDHIYEVWLCNK